MSKSLGNVVDPKLVIEGGNNKKKEPPYGADTLRLWVASVNYAADVCIGPSIIAQQSDAYRKLRNTARFLLGNLHDYNPEVHAVPYDELPALDRYMLGVLTDFTTDVKSAYDDFQFSRALGLLQQFAVSDLSNFYLDIAKDRLYISAPDETRRRQCQTVIDALLRGFVAAMAPVLPHLAEDIWQFLPYATPHASVFAAGWPAFAHPTERKDEWAAMRTLRDEVNKALEKLRADKTIGASLEAGLMVASDDPLLKPLLSEWSAAAAAGDANGVDELRYFFLTSQAELAPDAAAVEAAAAYTVSADEPSFTLGVGKATGKKCERCWHYSAESTYGSDDYPGVCDRCATALERMAFAPPKFSGVTEVPEGELAKNAA